MAGLRNRINQIITDACTPLLGNVSDFRSQQTNQGNSGTVGQVISVGTDGTALVMMSDGTTTNAAIGLRSVSIGDSVAVIGNMIF